MQVVSLEQVNESKLVVEIYPLRSLRKSSTKENSSSGRKVN